jgi:hypothetical protein
MARSANAIRLHDAKLEKLEGDALDRAGLYRRTLFFFGAAEIDGM